MDQTLIKPMMTSYSCSKANGAFSPEIQLCGEQNNNNLTNYKRMFCLKCNSLFFIKIKKDTNNEEISIKLYCENNHTEIVSLNYFLNNYEKYYMKKCQNCNINLNINQLLYCYSCDKVFCEKCKDKHLIINKNNTNEHQIESFVLKKNVCKKHLFKINQFYCNKCQKYICKECLDKYHNNHNIINLYINNDKIKEKLKSNIERSENINIYQLKKFNNLINTIRNNFNEISHYKKTIVNIKKNIINNYENNHQLYNNVKNLAFIEKEFNNKKELTNNCNKLYNKFNNNNK